MEDMCHEGRCCQSRWRGHDCGGSGVGEASGLGEALVKENRVRGPGRDAARALAQTAAPPLRDCGTGGMEV